MMQNTSEPKNGHLGYLLTAYLFDNLSAAGRKEVETHIAGCGQCRDELESLRRTLGAAAKALDSGGKEYVFEERRRQRVMRAAQQARPARSGAALPGSSWVWWLAAAGVCVLLVGMILPSLTRSRMSARLDSDEYMPRSAMAQAQKSAPPAYGYFEKAAEAAPKAAVKSEDVKSADLRLSDLSARGPAVGQPPAQAPTDPLGRAVTAPATPPAPPPTAAAEPAPDTNRAHGYGVPVETPPVAQTAPAPAKPAVAESKPAPGGDRGLVELGVQTETAAAANAPKTPAVVQGPGSTVNMWARTTYKATAATVPQPSTTPSDTSAKIPAQHAANEPAPSRKPAKVMAGEETDGDAGGGQVFSLNGRAMAHDVAKEKPAQELAHEGEIDALEAQTETEGIEEKSRLGVRQEIVGRQVVTRHGGVAIESKLAEDKESASTANTDVTKAESGKQLAATDAELKKVRTELSVRLDQAGKEATKEEVEQLKTNIEQLRRKLADSPAAMSKAAESESAMASRYGPGATVATRSGVLTLGGLLQVQNGKEQRQAAAGQAPAGGGGQAGQVFFDDSQSLTIQPPEKKAEKDRFLKTFEGDLDIAGVAGNGREQAKTAQVVGQGTIEWPDQRVAKESAEKNRLADEQRQPNGMMKAKDNSTLLGLKGENKQLQQAAQKVADERSRPIQAGMNMNDEQLGEETVNQFVMGNLSRTIIDGDGGGGGPEAGTALGRSAGRAGAQSVEKWGEVLVPADLQKLAEFGDHFETTNPDKPEARKASKLADTPALGALFQTQKGKAAFDPNALERSLRGYRYFRAENPQLTFRDFLRRPAPVPAPVLTDLGLDEDLYIERYGTRPFVDCARDNLSTFGMDVDTASYTLTRARLREGKLPEADTVRVEEFLNYFKQPYTVSGEDAFGVFAEGAPEPFGSTAFQAVNEHGQDARATSRAAVELLKIGIKSREARPDERKPAMLTFVVDTSGSMVRDDRLELVREALKGLIGDLSPDDAVAIVGFSNEAELLLPRTQARHKQRLLDAIAALEAHGATNIEAGLNLAYRIADESYSPDAVNRMILCSDGAANVGAKGPDELLKLVKVFAGRGIDLCTIGFGMGQYHDKMMMTLADNGNGTYHFVDSQAEARKVFREQLPPHLNVLAKDAKVQVEFNPDVIARYRLLGYEKRKIADADFRNDKITAGEVAHSTLVTVMYEILRKPGSHGPLGKVYLRWKDAAYKQTVVVERNYPLSEGILVGDVRSASPELRFLACVARFAELLRGSPWVRDSSYAAVLGQLYQLPPEFRERAEWKEVQELVRRAQELSVKQWLTEAR